MLTGKHPFGESMKDGPAQRQAKRPVAASTLQPGVPRRVDRIIEKCLECEPANRFQTAAEVARELRGDPAEAISVPMPSWATGPRRWVMAAVLVLALAALIAVGVLAPGLLHPPYKPNERALDWYTRGLAAFRQGTYMSAQVLFQSALDEDKEFGLARVHLAEAWNELDFKGSADEAMRELTAGQENGMSSSDHDYAEAVRATLSQDFKAAAAGFKRVLKDLPEDARAAGNVDVGRVEEKAGNIAAALEAYHAAIKLAPNSPAAYLRSAVLESRHGEDKEAEADFDHADKLFGKLGALEGQAEVDYQRSYWQSMLGNYDAARGLAEQSMDEARHMTQQSVQLQVRAMCRLSAIAHGQRQDDKALEEAEKAIALAHDNELEYWETDARLRQGAAYYGKRKYVDAGDSATKALTVAKRRKWPRLIALAEVNLASVRGARSQKQDVVALTAALDYYKRYQFPRESLYPLLFLVQEKNRQSQFEGARQSGIELLSLARKSTILAQAEEEMGKSCLGLQQYPDALAHFDAALEAAKQSNDTETAPYEMLYSADALGSLGRLEDAKRLLDPLKDEELDGWPSLIRVRILSMQLNYAEAAKIARRTLAAYPGLTPGTGAEFRITGVIAAAKTGDLVQARKWAREATALAQKAGDPGTTANVSLAQAVLDFKEGSLQEAKSATNEALTFFQAHGQKESEWLALYHLALTEKAFGSKAAARQAASKSLDILSVLEHNWGAPAKLTYERRPDVSAAAAELHQIAGK
jgi:tetratricopeptide (TPR) repeat protein